MEFVDLDPNLEDHRWLAALAVLRELREHLTRANLREVLLGGAPQGLRFTAVFCQALNNSRLIASVGVMDRPAQREADLSVRELIGDRTRVAAGSQRFPQSRSLTVGAGQAMVEVDPVGLEVQSEQGVALSGQVLLIGGASGVPDMSCRGDAVGLGIRLGARPHQQGPAPSRAARAGALPASRQNSLLDRNRSLRHARVSFARHPRVHARVDCGSTAVALRYET